MRDGGIVLPSSVQSLKDTGKSAVRSLIPLSVRKRLAIWVHRQRWLDADRRSWWSVELVRDFAEKDINAYHKFLWSHHLAYAAPYEVAARFGDDKMRVSRQMFFADLRRCMEELGLSSNDIRSVLEVGCSLGYQLRHMETGPFAGAGVLDGIDIDEYAVRSGQEYLSSVGSKISLKCGDIQALDDLIGDRVYDLILCTGVLMYLRDVEAAAMMRAMFTHCRVLVAMAGLAHSEIDNAALGSSVIRKHDRTFIHNLDSMVKSGGGRVLARRWEGARQVDGQTIYFVFAGPQCGSARR